MKLWRMDRLSKNTLLCLFIGEIRRVDIHQKPEAVHFGVSRSGKKENSYYKPIRTDEAPEDEKRKAQVTWRNLTLRVVNIEKLDQDLKDAAKDAGYHIDSFALQLIEGVQAVRFLISSL